MLIDEESSKVGILGYGSVCLFCFGNGLMVLVSIRDRHIPIHCKTILHTQWSSKC